ncbi:cytochrome P450 [Apiospora marii]|uniref:Cytochrome P450 n=1 Tax=Apiospora marii TaxID=335849 RepID=A0ABR1RFN3_9PEZI
MCLRCKCTTLLVQRLRENCAQCKIPQDMTDWYHWTTFDALGDLAFGEPFDCLEKARYNPWVTHIF